MGCARSVVADEPFAVLLPDEVMGDARLITQLSQSVHDTGVSAVGLMRVPRDQVSAYGVITPREGDSGGRSWHSFFASDQVDPKRDAPDC